MKTAFSLKPPALRTNQKHTPDTPQTQAKTHQNTLANPAKKAVKHTEAQKSTPKHIKKKLKTKNTQTF
jgi:hypothetical protein